MPVRYTREQLAAAVAGASTWAGVMRTLGLRVSGGQRRMLQEDVAKYGLDTDHFTRRSPWSKYPDDAIAAAVASSSTLREVVGKLGARPATGTLSHIRRRIAAAGMDVSHFPALNRPKCELPFSDDELRKAAASVRSLRALARALDVPDDGRSRAALRRMLHAAGVNVSHFSHARVAVPDAELRQAVAHSPHYAGVLRSLRMPVDEVNRRRVQRRTGRLGLDTSHFQRRSRLPRQVTLPKPIAHEVFALLPEGSPRTKRDRLRRALDEIGVPYACVRCGNSGAWDGAPLTLQIDHINGDWRDDRRDNLRYLCPNCHAITETWCGRNRRRGSPSTDHASQ
ncbi:MAG: HNH endonuclease signature motif containing protein [Streptomyces sp.]|uniref:HNH endonuclease signature motif containing protein n=1 Tax=Streptomyces sp. TaxID=1931 RepID=UPI003D6C09CD